MPRIDELTNEQLLEKDHGFTRDELSLELDSVANTIRRNVSAGSVDLTYYFERERVLNDLLDSDA